MPTPEQILTATVPKSASYFSLMRAKVHDSNEDKHSLVGRALLPFLMESANNTIQKTKAESVLGASLGAIGLSSAMNLGNPSGMLAWAGLSLTLYISSVLYTNTNQSVKQTLNDWVEKFDHIPLDNQLNYLQASTDEHGHTFIERLIFLANQNDQPIDDDLLRTLGKLLNKDKARLKNFIVHAHIISKNAKEYDIFTKIISFRVSNPPLEKVLESIKADPKLEQTMKKQIEENFSYRLQGVSYLQ